MRPMAAVADDEPRETERESQTRLTERCEIKGRNIETSSAGSDLR